MRVRGLALLTFLASSLPLIQRCMGDSAPLQQPLPTNATTFNSTEDATLKSSVSNNSTTLPLAAGTRPVYLVMSVRLSAAQIFPPTYDKLFPVYASLHFNATFTDGPLDIQLVNKNGQDIIRVTDLGLSNKDKPMGVPQPGYLVDYFELFGQSNATNDQILNIKTGKGLVHDVWARNSSLALKAWNSVDFMHACIEHLGLGLAPSNNLSAIIPTRIVQAQLYWRNLWVSEKVVSHFPVWLETLTGWGDQVQKTRAEFNFKAGADASIGMVASRPVPTDSTNASSNDSLNDNNLSDLAAPEMTETYQASINTTKTAPDYQWIYAQPVRQNGLHRRAGPGIPKQFLVVQPGEEPPVLAAQLNAQGNVEMQPAGPEPGAPADGHILPADQPAPPVEDLVPPENQANTAVTARTNLKTTLRFVTRGFGILEIPSIIAIVVLDFKTGNSVPILSGTFSVIISIIGVLCLLGPEFYPALGDLVLLSAIFVGEIPDFSHSTQNMAAQGAPIHAGTTGQPGIRGIDSGFQGRSLPSLPTPPLRTDVQGILQYTIVGDRNKTGNEKCISKGYHECTVVYGPYLLATALKLETFDAFALLIHFNEGYPMAMTDLIKAFTLSSDSNSANQVATIDCSHSTKPNDRFSWSDPNTATILKQCDNPIFSIKRELINVPIINEPADQVYNRLMPHGNCSLVGDVSGGERYPAYNLTISGGAVAIACGIVGAININGTAQPITAASIAGLPPNNTLPSIGQMPPVSTVNPGNQSSDGSSGRGYLAPPPIHPFQMTFNLDNSICMGASDGTSLFFPNGTYDSQVGSLGFDSTKANTLTLGANSSVVITESTMARSKPIYAHAPAPPPTYVDHQVTYKTNQSATDTAFAGDMQNMVKYKKENTFTVYVSTPPDVVCFYQQPRGGGDFACFGPGGGDLPTGLKGRSRSVKAFGRASVEIFANSYGNSFAHIVDTSEDDLATWDYDDKSSFADVASSIWVWLEPKPTA